MSDGVVVRLGVPGKRFYYNISFAGVFYIAAVKMSYSAGTLYGIFLEIFGKIIDKKLTT
jgi:hypothetical protein